MFIAQMKIILENPFFMHCHDHKLFFFYSTLRLIHTALVYRIHLLLLYVLREGCDETVYLFTLRVENKEQALRVSASCLLSIFPVELLEVVNSFMPQFCFLKIKRNFSNHYFFNNFFFSSSLPFFVKSLNSLENK